MTLDGLDGRNALLQKKIILRSSSEKKLNKDRLNLSAAKCRPMILVSRSIKYICGYSRGFLGRGSGVVEVRNFRRLLLAICSESLDRTCRIYIYTALPRLFSDPQFHDLEWTWIAISRQILVSLSVWNNSTCSLINRVGVHWGVARDCPS